ncbi:MAG: replicative DNA helicase [Oscillospiraceae bacterium]|nr:replicative DNA helicase [Oscillospiraceae bacterium]
MSLEDQLLNRSMPHSPEAEQAVLGSMLIDGDCVKDVMDKLHADDFYLQHNRDIFEAICSMFIRSLPIDGVTVAGEMDRSGTGSENTRGYLLQLMEVTPTSANVMEYVRIVRDKALMRAVATAAAEITAEVQKGAGSATGLLELAEQKIYDVRRGRAGQGMTPISVVLPEVMDQLAELMANGGKTLPGLTTGFSVLDAKTNGLGKGNLVILAARPGMGKTSMALNVALNAAKSTGKTVAIFSLEMSKTELVKRLISGEGLVENKRLATGNLRENDWVKIAEAASALSRTDIRIEDNSMLTVAEMNAKCRRMDNLGLVVIDYLQLMNGADDQGRRGDNRQTVVSDMSRMLKIMAKNLGVPVLCLSQLSRANEQRKENKRPMLSDLRESGAIEQDADVVMFLYREDYYDKQTEEQNIAECIIAKNRHGETDTVKLRWMPEFTSFGTLEERYGDEE